MNVILYRIECRTGENSREADCAREPGKDLDAVGETRRHLLVEQVKITYRRARILRLAWLARLAIILSSVSILCVTVTVLSIFVGQVLGAQVEYVSAPAFGLGLLALLGPLYEFIRDVTISLRALELEISSYGVVGRP
ncbi:hypothetical protein SBA4_330043 [Candidatus Sulfopaludibacter sp. SbA4]|nr:hypothetical protein SBA4_330043 [Candidatus Sulfopaludibacter sp. SbA4]